MAKFGHFDICKIMTTRNLDIRLSLLDNVTELKRIKDGTRVSIGIYGDVMGIAKGDFIGGLLLCNAKQYEEIRKELEAQSSTDGDK